MTRTSRPALEGRVPGTRWRGAGFQCHRLKYDRHTGVQSALETGSPDNPLKVAHPVKARKLNGGSTSSHNHRLAWLEDGLSTRHRPPDDRCIGGWMPRAPKVSVQTCTRFDELNIRFHSLIIFSVYRKL